MIITQIYPAKLTNNYSSACNSYPKTKPLMASTKIEQSPKIDSVSFGRIFPFKNHVKILDCTLRDGGFVNNWRFGKDNITAIFKKLDNADVDIIEVGYLFKDTPFSKTQTRFTNTQAINEIFGQVKEKHALVSAMIDYGNCGLDNLSNKKDCFIDVVRLAFKKGDQDKALEFAEEIKEKGYKLFIQPTSITSYDKKEVIKLIKKINKVKPMGVGLVDTYGLLDKEELLKYFKLFNRHLDRKTAIDFHGHNNLQLALSNALEIAEQKTSRKIYLDSSLFGMGKGSGNVATEALSMELNKNHKGKYGMKPIIEAISDYILPNYGKKPKWGYSLNHFVSSLNRCHPDYVAHLSQKNLSFAEINGVLSKMDPDKKLKFDAKYIDEFIDR